MIMSICGGCTKMPTSKFKEPRSHFMWNVAIVEVSASERILSWSFFLTFILAFCQIYYTNPIKNPEIACKCLGHRQYLPELVFISLITILLFALDYYMSDLKWQTKNSWIFPWFTDLKKYCIITKIKVV